MSRIVFSNGQTVNFNGNPTQADIEEISSQMQGGATQPQPQQAPQPNPYGATFRDAGAGNETGLSAGLKSTGNTLGSYYNLGKSAVDMVVNPIDTVKGIGSAITDVGRKVTNKLTDITGLGKKQETNTLSAIGSVFNDRFGTSFGDKKFSVDDMLRRLQTTAIEDPVGFGADIAGILTGGAATIGKTAQLGNVASKVAQVTTAPVRVPVRVAAKGASEVTKFGVSQATGLTPDTLKTVMTQSKAFGEARAAGLSRTDLATDVFAAINKASDELGDLGKGYDTIRKSPGVVSLPDNWLAPSLEKFGLKLKDDGVKTQVFADRGSQTRNVTDINKIQNFVDNWGDSKTFTKNEYLNMRSDLAEIAKFDQAGSDVSRSFATNLREGTLNSDGVRAQVTGLKELDSMYAKDITFFKKLKKEFLDGQGNLKDGAASKVVNAVNTANPQRLARLEKLYPGFTKQAQVIKAVEDVEAAMGLKVGAYVRAGTAVAGFATGNLPLIISAILATPEIAIPLLKAMGLTGQKAAPVLKAIRDFSSDINNFRTPGAVAAYIEKNYKDGIPVGMSIQDVTKRSDFNKSATTQTTLLEEAKGFKSAEEFVKAQGLELVRGSGKSGAGEVDLFGKGLYLTDDIDVAKFYGDNITTSIVSGKMLDATKSLLQKDFDLIIGGLADEMGIRKIDYAFNEGIKLSDIVNEIDSVTPPNTFIKWAKENDVYNDFNPSANVATAVGKVLKDKGVKGIKYSTDEIDDLYDNNLGGRNAFVILDSTGVKTKQELTDIWKQANQ